ncbi:MAG: sigma 54-interacting transcriptional regulator [Vibrio sp.]
MGAKEDLFQTIKLLDSFKKHGFTASDCQEHTSLKRSVISHYLNRLCDDNLLMKENTRPVRFYFVDSASAQEISKPTHKNDIFNQFIGSDGCLSDEISMCRSSVSYPPNGLPLLICGESGVGKSYLATLVYQHSLETKVIQQDSRFIVLNCADYANNPELLSATLFGYVKGAFTGATTDKKGLLDDANNGVLFLDEVHRLSAENQEKLFIFMDQGFFYRLGDNNNRQYSTVRFIFATTEDIEQSLLTTFKRRIPFVIKLPKFSSRPQLEKISIILSLFKKEAENLKLDIEISQKLLIELLNSDFQGNVGGLKNKIKVECASAFNNRTNQSILNVGPISPETPVLINSNVESIPHWDGIKLFKDESVISTFCHSGNWKVFSKRLVTALKQRFGEQDLLQLYAGFLWSNVRDSIKDFEYITGIDVNHEQYASIYYILVYLMINENNENIHKSISDGCVNKTNKSSLLSDELLSSMKSKIEFPDTITDSLNSLYSILLSSYVDSDNKIQAVIVSHGRSTASSIAGMANRLCGGYYFKAFDMPFSVDTRAIIDMLIKHIDKIKNGKGLIILVDMGSLQEIYQEIKLYIHDDLLVLNNVTTSIALDIGSKIQDDISMKQIIEDANKNYKIETRYYKGIKRGSKIIISCISGEGISKKLREIMLPYLKDPDIEVVTMEYDDLKWKIKQSDSALNGTKLIITTTDLDAEHIPLVNVKDLISSNGHYLYNEYFSDLIDEEKNSNMLEEVVRFFTIGGVSERLTFLNPNVVIDEVELVIKQYESFYQIHFESYLRMNLFMHIALMIERQIIGTEMNSRNDDELTAEQDKFIQLQPDFFKHIFEKYRITLSRTEMLLVYEILESWISD